MSARAEARTSEIISGLIEARRSIVETASSLPPAAQDKVFLGVWSVKDLLAHLVGWDFANIEAAEAILAGRLPGFYAHHDRDWRTFNAGLIATYKRDDFGELLSSVGESHRKLIDFLKTVPAEEFTMDRGLRFKGYKVTIARLMQAEADDEKEHYEQVKEFAASRDP